VARDEGLRNYYKQLLQLRQQHPALRRGDYTLLTQPQDAALAFARRDAASGDHVLVLANRDEAPLMADVALPEGMAGAALSDRISGQAVAADGGRLKIELAPKSVRFIAPTQPKAAR
jgi:cyclomaltodextrinase / maltogenic alpha-amylase / neopullulanase